MSSLLVTLAVLVPQAKSSSKCYLRLEVVPFQGVLQRLRLVLQDGLAGEDAFGRVGRVAGEELHGVFELHRVLPLALACGKPGLAPFGLDVLAEVDFAA